MSQDFYFPGATTLGIACKDGVVLASEKRITFGSGILSKSGKKVFKISENIGAACAGLVSDFQVLISTINAYTRLYELDSQHKISVKAAAKMMSNVLYARKFFPLFTNTIIGGLDKKGIFIYTMDALGSMIDDKYATTGTGSEIAIGVLESEYSDDLTVDQAEKIAIQAIRAAAQRDPASGDGIDVLKIKKEESILSTHSIR